MTASCGVAVDDVARFQALYVDLHADVLAYFLRRLDRDEAVDAAADVFLSAWRRIGEVPTGRDSRPWTFGVAHNVLRNHRRSARRALRLRVRVANAGAEQRLGPEILVVEEERSREVLAALERLRPLDRELVRLRLWDESSFQEIGALLGCSSHAAEQRYARVLRRLRRYTAHHVYADERAGIVSAGGES